MDTAIVDYWVKHYVNNGLCSLCGNHGWIDTTGKCSPAGVPAGRVNYCICPNGQIMRVRFAEQDARAFLAERKGAAAGEEDSAETRMRTAERLLRRWTRKDMFSAEIDALDTETHAFLRARKQP